MCSKIAPRRVSFSHDLSGFELQISPEKVHDGVPFKNKLNLESIPEFEFSISRSFEFESSSADQLFSNGVMLPIQIQEKKNTKPTKHTRFEEPPNMSLPPRPSSPGVDKIKKESIIEILDGVHEKKPQLTSLLSFSKSRSLHCDAKSSFMVPSSPPLPRSKSTGSPNLKRVASKSSSSTFHNLYPVQKSRSGKSYVNSLRVTPILNLPTPSISKGSSASLFGLCPFLCVGKVNNVKN